MATLQEQFRASLKKAETIQQAAEMKGAWGAEDEKAYNEAIEQAKTLKAQVEKAQELDALKAWSKEPDGKSAVKAGWSGEVVADEGDKDGVTADANDKSGELYGYNKLGEKTVKTLKSGEYKDAFVQYLRAAAKGQSIKGDAMKVLQEGVDTSGGFWVPVDQRADVVKKMATVAGFRNDVYRFTTGSDVVQFPKVVYTTDDKYTAGVFTSWTGSAEAPSSDISENTNPAAGRVTIPVNTATAAIIVTRAMLEDSVFDILGYLSALLGESFALAEDDAFINGSGSGTPQGALNHANATVAHTSGGMYVPSGTSAAFGWGDGTPKGIIGIEGALPPQYDNNAKWYAAKLSYASIRALNATTAGIQWSLGEQYPNAGNGYQATLLGHPIVKDQFLPAVAANSYSLLFGDASAYYVAERVGLSIEVLREVKALRDEVVVYARRRVGGQLVHDWKLKDMKLATS